MKNYLNAIPWIIISFLLSTMFVYRECNRPIKIEYLPGDTITKTDTIKGDSIPVPYPVMEIRTVDCTKYIQVPSDVDTNAILSEFFAENYYTRYPIVDDTNAYIAIDALVSENRLRWILPYVQIRRPRIVNHYTTVIHQNSEQNKIKFRGGGFGMNYPGGYDFGVAAGVEYKRWSLEYGKGVGRTNIFILAYEF